MNNGYTADLTFGAERRNFEEDQKLRDVIAKVKGSCSKCRHVKFVPKCVKQFPSKGEMLDFSKGFDVILIDIRDLVFCLLLLLGLWLHASIIGP